MVDKIIEEINIALDNDLYFVALNSVLTLPDICGKAEYPSEKTSDRYKHWYQKYIGEYEQEPEEKMRDSGFPYLSGDVVYDLRCSLLHQGNPNLSNEKHINKFELIIEDKNEFDVYADMASMTLSIKPYKTYSVSIRRLCFIICKAAKKYYEDNKDKFNFFNYKIRRYK